MLHCDQGKRASAEKALCSPFFSIPFGKLCTWAPLAALAAYPGGSRGVQLLLLSSSLLLPGVVALLSPLVARSDVALALSAALFLWPCGLPRFLGGLPLNPAQIELPKGVLTTLGGGTDIDRALSWPYDR